MSSIQGSMNRLLGFAAAATTISDKLGDKKKSSSDSKGASGSDSGVDAKMAQKARRIAMQKIKAIYNNKQISQKAMSRRVGQVLDGLQGGKK